MVLGPTTNFAPTQLYSISELFRSSLSLRLWTCFWCTCSTCENPNHVHTALQNKRLFLLLMSRALQQSSQALSSAIPVETHPASKKLKQMSMPRIQQCDVETAPGHRTPFWVSGPLTFSFARRFWGLGHCRFLPHKFLGRKGPQFFIFFPHLGTGSAQITCLQVHLL